MRINFQLSTEASLLLAQACRQLDLTPEDLIEGLIIELLRSPKNSTTLSSLIGHKLQTMERTHRVLKRTAELQEQLHSLLV